MTKEALIQKLSSLEWEDFEVKKAQSEVPKSLWETVSSFSNTSGGWIVLGVSEKEKHFEITGVQNAEKLEQDFLNTLRGNKFNVFVEARSEKYHFDNKVVLAFFIPVHKNKPVYFNNQSNTFIRRGSADQRATQAEIDSMLRDRAFGTKTSELAPGTSYSDAHLRYTYRMDEQENVWEYTQPHYQIALDSVIIDFPLVSVLGNGESTRNISGISAENELTADDYGRLWTIG